MPPMPAMPEEVVTDEVTEYPGVQFTPPKGTVDDGALEGEALVMWKKVGDKFTIVEFEGTPLAAENETIEPPSSLEELKAMDTEGE